MNLLSLVPKRLTRAVGMLMLKARGASPEICLIGGLLVGGSALVMVGVNTWKGKDILKQDADAIRDAKTIVINEDGEVEDEATEETALVPADKERQKLILAKRIDLAKDICKIYWIPAALGVSSVLLIWGGRTLLRRELSAMTAAYAALAESYRRYRERVAKQIGPEKEQELQYGVGNPVMINEQGETIHYPDSRLDENLSPYAFLFSPGEWDDGSREYIWKNYEWSKNNLANQLRITQAQNWANDQLITRGWVLLYEVAERLGAKPNPYWFRVGWRFKPGQDNKVELGVLNSPFQIPFNKAFMDPNNPQNIAVIDPNVDGCIDDVFCNIEQFDFRCGRRTKPKKRMPSLREMFGEEYARKLAQN